MGMERKMKKQILAIIFGLQMIGLAAAIFTEGYLALAIISICCAALNICLYGIEQYQGKIETVYLSK